VTEAEATKKKFKIFRAPRLTAKGVMFIDLVGGDADNNAAATSAARPATAAAKPAADSSKKTSNNPVSLKAGASRPQTALPGRKPATAAVEETSVTTNENLLGVNDPIAHAIQSRLKAGGLASVVKEADAKKQGFTLSSAPKHVVKPGSNALLSLVVDNTAAPKVAEPAKALALSLKSPRKKPASL